MFLVGVIAAVDRFDTHRRFLGNLQRYGLETQAVVSFTDLENQRIGVDFIDPNGLQRFGVLDMRYYNDDWWKILRNGSSIRIRFINAPVSDNDRAILADEYARVLAYFPIGGDLWGLLLGSWVLVMFKPQAVFIGLLSVEQLFKGSAR